MEFLLISSCTKVTSNVFSIAQYGCQNLKENPRKPLNDISNFTGLFLRQSLPELLGLLSSVAQNDDQSYIYIYIYIYIYNTLSLNIGLIWTKRYRIVYRWSSIKIAQTILLCCTKWLPGVCRYTANMAVLFSSLPLCFSFEEFKSKLLCSS